MRRSPNLVLGVAIVAGLTVGLTACGGSEPEGDAMSTASSAEQSANVVKRAAPSTATCDPASHSDLAYAERGGTPPGSTSLDVYPAPDACTGEATPIVVWVHGGGWSIGDKANVGAKLQLFHDLGAAVVSVNYRLSSRTAPDTATDPVRHPDHADDVAAAIAWVTDHGASIGGDPRRVVLVGHSAGAHLVTLVGADPTYLREAGVPEGAVKCVVALDTEGYDLTEKVSLGGASETLVRNAFGDDPAVWVAASPLTHARDGSPVRFLLITRGLPHRRSEAANFADAVNAAGGDAELVSVTGYTHADVNRRLGEPGETVVTPPVADFVRECIASS